MANISFTFTINVPADITKGEALVVNATRDVEFAPDRSSPGKFLESLMTIMSDMRRATHEINREALNGAVQAMEDMHADADFRR